MKNKAIVLAISGLIGTGYVIAAVYDSMNFNPSARALQPVPTGHIVGKDNSPDPEDKEFGTHMAGEDCGLCHTPGGKADPNNENKYVFTMAGTLYEDKAARKPLAGGEVILTDYSGKVISMTSNEAGNFWTYEPITSYPLAVAGHGTIHKLYTEDDAGNIIKLADPTDSRSWLYKVWVKKGDQVIQSPDFKPVGGSSDPGSRMGCAMHHAPSGSRGALWLSEKGTLASYPKKDLSFKKHVLPILMSKCASCHRPGATTTRAVMKSDVKPAFDLANLYDPDDGDAESTMYDFSGMHDLTAYEDQSITVGTGPTAVIWAKHGTGYYSKKDTNNPGMNALLIKTVKGGQEHAGGTFWTPDHPDYKAIRQWIAEGGLNN